MTEPAQKKVKIDDGPSIESGREAQCSKDIVDFNQDVDRTAYPTVKHDMATAVFGPGAEGAMKMWVADMELPCCPAIQRAIVARAQHGSFGYTMKPQRLWDSVASWLVERQGWKSRPKLESFVWSASVITSGANALRAFTELGDGVVVMTPLYGPLQKIVEGTGRHLVKIPLHLDKNCNRYTMDLDNGAMEDALQRCSAVIMCNPHNPTGRVWRETELAKLAKMCAKHNVLVISDEIWADWCHDGHTFVPFRDIAAAAKCKCVTLGAPTKTWSLAGIHTSYIIIEDDAMRAKYMSWVEPAFLCFANTFGSTAMLAAYDHGAQWLQGAREHVQGNIDFLEDYLKRYVPKVKVVRPEATYVVWLDCSGLGLGPDELVDFMIERARLVLAKASSFDPEGTSGHFQRINVACSRPTLEEALRRMRVAVDAFSSKL